jgi:hypothetical protein
MAWGEQILKDESIYDSRTVCVVTVLHVVINAVRNET